MYWERVSEQIYLFTSDRYALVNSVAVVTDRGIIVIDGLPFPDEAKQIARFLEVRTGADFYSLILTHHHMDHAYGLFAFPERLDVIGSELCRQRLLEVEASLAEARESDPAFEEVTSPRPRLRWSPVSSPSMRQQDAQGVPVTRAYVRQHRGDDQGRRCSDHR